MHVRGARGAAAAAVMIRGCARRVFFRRLPPFQKKKTVNRENVRMSVIGCPAAPPLLRLSPPLSLSECARARALLLFCVCIGGAGETQRAATSCTRSSSKPPPRASAPRRRRNGAQPGVRLAAEAADDRQFWCALCSDAAAVAAAAAAAAARAPAALSAHTLLSPLPLITWAPALAHSHSPFPSSSDPPSFNKLSNYLRAQRARRAFSRRRA